MPNFELVSYLVILSIILVVITQFVKKDIIKNVTLIIAFIISTFGIGQFTGHLERFNYNIWYSASTKDLISEIIIKMENNENEIVLKELKKIQSELKTGYEQRGNYNELVNESVKNLKQKN
jgi:hypothetical protein